MEKSITKILDIISGLSKKEKQQAERIFLISVFDSKMNVPNEKEAEWDGKYGGIENLKNQRIVRIDNLLTGESTLFNSLRASRPMQKSSEEINLESDKGNDDFCNPLTATPYDTFGRMKGKGAITASNLMKYDCYHDVIILNEHNPLKFTSESTSDAIDLALRWFKKVYGQDKEACYPFLIWNCLWRSGASMVHGHLQATMTKKRHYPNAELLKKVSDDYKKKYKNNYLKDIYKIHESLNLGFSHKDVKIIASLTPIKEKEIILISRGLTKNLKEAIYKTLKCFRDELGVQSFNVSFIMPPIGKGWKDFPCLVRIVDRGSLNNKTSDIGAMELYAGSSVVSSDPFSIIEFLKRSFKK